MAEEKMVEVPQDMINKLYKMARELRVQKVTVTYDELRTQEGRNEKADSLLLRHRDMADTMQSLLLDFVDDDDE